MAAPANFPMKMPAQMAQKSMKQPKKAGSIKKKLL
eukprot:UN08249